MLLMIVFINFIKINSNWNANPEVGEEVRQPYHRKTYTNTCVGLDLSFVLFYMKSEVLESRGNSENKLNVFILQIFIMCL